LNFNEQVYALVKLIPPGKVLTYGRVAALLNVTQGARAVGWALNALTTENDVPWHRVINAQRQISLRNSPAAAERQRERLEAEGVQFDEAGRVPVSTIWTPSLWEIREKLNLP